MRFRLLAIFICCAWSAAGRAQTAITPEALLAQMRAASGGAAWNRVSEIREHGTMKENGFTGQLTLSQDLKTGRSAFNAVFPAVNARIGSGVHGDEIWTLNQDGDLAIHARTEDDAGALTDAYLYRRAYWQPGFDGATVMLDPPITEDNITFERVRITPAHGETFVLWINEATHLLDRVQRGDSALHYADYRTVNGLKLPFSVGSETNGHEDYTFEFQNIEVKDKLDEADLAIPFYRDFEMPASGVATVPTEHGIIFDVMINGKGPFKMFFDTGSINMLTEKVAKQLGIGSEGDTKKLATGSGSIDVRPVRLETLQIGDVTLHDQPFQMADFSADPGLPVGVVGYEFMQRFVVKIDYVHNRMTLYDPARFRFGDGVTVPMLVQSHAVFVKGSIDGFKGLFALDTGNQVALELEPGFVRINDLVGWTHARFHGYAGRTYGGQLPEAYFTRIHRLMIGDAEADEIAANLSQGEVHDGEPDANIGESVFKQFNVTFDAIRGKLYLERNANWGPVPFNRAGIVTDPQDDGLKVMTVLPGSSGEGAGLQVGNLITKIDGSAPADTTDESVFQRPVGTVLHLTVKRGETLQEITVKLEDSL